jgi:hypothetical protein
MPSGQLAPETVPYADPKKAGQERKITLADAKKNGWVPSVSVYLDTIAKHGLQTYYDYQLLDAVKRHPDSGLWLAGEFEGEGLRAYIAKVMEMRDEHRDLASETGTKVHAYIQRKIEGKPLPEIEPGLLATAEAMYRECPVDLVGAQTEATFVRLDLGYAGTPDIVAEGCIVDWKTQGKPGKKMEKRDTWGMQLAAYAFGVLRRPCTAYIVCGSTVAPGDVKVWKYTDIEISKEYQRFDLIRRYWQATKDFNNTDAAVAA